MTRHGMVKTPAAGAPPPATYPRAFMAIIAADRVATSRLPGRLNRAEAQQRGLSASITPLPGRGRAIADISHRSESP
jgi:hypothetical protein